MRSLARDDAPCGSLYAPENTWATWLPLALIDLYGVLANEPDRRKIAVSWGLSEKEQERVTDVTLLLKALGAKKHGPSDTNKKG